jgi:hypothetical protein
MSRAGTPRQKLTREQIDEIVRLREDEKWTTHRIAKHTGISQAGVNYQLLRAGVDPWDAENHPPTQKPRRPFTPEEDARLLALGREGKGPWQIARALDRPDTSVRIRLMTLEVRAERALERSP